jgi:membrane protease YdiL (CAAX protease family)
MKSEYGPLAGFFILVFVLSIPFWILGNVYPVQLLPGLPASALGVLAPALAAGIMTYRRSRLPAVGQLLARSFDLVRIHNKYWFLVFVLFNPFVAVLAFFIVRAIGRSVPQPSPLTFSVVPMFAFFFIGALGEEIGWTGYATEPVHRRWGTLVTGLALGVVWAVFHLVVLTQANRSPGWIAWWSLGTISLRVLMVWLYQHAGKSVFAAAIFHAMINLSWQLFPINGSFYDPQVFSLVTLGLAVVIFVAHGIVTRGSSHAAQDLARLDR